MTGEKDLSVTSLTTNETNYHLSRINSFIDSASLDRLMMWQLSQTSFPLTVSVGVYTIGPGATFNMARPTKIVDPCFVRDSGGYDSPLTLINMEAYGRIVLKSVDGSYPSMLAYDFGYSATSTASVYLYPEPAAGLTLYINTLQPLTNFSTVTQNVQLPPGYQDFIETNYAIRSALGIIPVSNDLKDAARQAKAAIKSANLPAPISRLDYSVSQRRTSIITGP